MAPAKRNSWYHYPINGGDFCIIKSYLPSYGTIKLFFLVLANWVQMRCFTDDDADDFLMSH